MPLSNQLFLPMDDEPTHQQNIQHVSPPAQTYTEISLDNTPSKPSCRSSSPMLGVEVASDYLCRPHTPHNDSDMLYCDRDDGPLDTWGRKKFRLSSPLFQNNRGLDLTPLLGDRNSQQVFESSNFLIPV